MSKGSNFMKFYNNKSKAKSKKGLRHGRFTPLQVERSTGSSILSGVVKSKFAAGIVMSKKIPETSGYQSDLLDFCQNHGASGDQHLTKKSNCIKTDLKFYLPVIKEPIIIAETQSSDGFIDTSQEEKQSHKILEDRNSIVNLESYWPANKEPIIIAETQYSDGTTDFSQEEEKSNNILENRGWTKSLIKLQNELAIATDTDLDSDFQIPDVIPCTYVIKKKKCAVAEKANKVLEKNRDSGAAEFKINKPPIVKPTVLARANTIVFYANDDLLKNSIIAKLNESKYKPEKKEEKKLAGMCVKMRHQVLPQHQVESTAGTRTMNPDERDRFEKYAVLRNGPFKNSEDEKIKDNWKTFCQDNDWDPKKPEPFLLMKHNTNKNFLMYNVENRRNFVRCLAHGLPDRCLYSVNHRFRNLFGNSSNKTDKYTESEDRKIREYLSVYPNLKLASESDHQYADLAKVLKRTRSSVWRRVRLLKKKAEETETSPSRVDVERREPCVACAGPLSHRILHCLPRYSSSSLVDVCREHRARAGIPNCP